MTTPQAATNERCHRSIPRGCLQLSIICDFGILYTNDTVACPFHLRSCAAVIIIKLKRETTNFIFLDAHDSLAFPLHSD